MMKAERILSIIIRILLGVPVWLFVNIMISVLNGQGVLTNLDMLLALIPTILFLEAGRKNKTAGVILIVLLSIVSPSEILELALVVIVFIGFFLVNSKKNLYDTESSHVNGKFSSLVDFHKNSHREIKKSKTNLYDKNWSAVNCFNFFENYAYDVESGYLYIKKFWIEKGLPRTRNYQICVQKINGVIQLDRVGIQFFCGLCNVIIPIPVYMDRNADYIILKNIRLSSGKILKCLLEQSLKRT